MGISLKNFDIQTIINNKDYLFSIDEYSSFTINFSRGIRIELQNSNGELSHIISNYSVESQEYIPGYWQIKIHYKNKIYIRYFLVLPPKNVGVEGLIAIRQVIESIIPGLSFDFSDSYFSNIVVGDMLTNIMKIKCNIIISKFNEITNNLSFVINHPIKTLEKSIVSSYQLGRQNNKTIIKNSKITSEKQYNVKVKENLNCLENSMLYYVLLSIKKHCDVIKNSLLYEQLIIEDKIEEFNKNAQNIYYKSLIEEYTNKNIKIDSIMLKINSISAKINNVIDILGLKNLTIDKKVITGKYLKNKSYSYLLEVSTLLNADSVSFLANKELKQHVLSYKSTPILFELYNYSLIKDILLQNKYTHISTDENQRAFTTMFYRNDSKIEVIYNTKIPKIDDITDDDYGIVSINSSHDTPDLVIIKYDKNEEVVAATIIDPKCRVSKNVINNPEILEQLRDYYQLRHISKNRKSIDKGFVINKIGCTYPIDTKVKQVEYNELEDIYYVGLELDKNFRSTNGYKILKEELLYFVK